MNESEFNYIMSDPHDGYIEGMARSQNISYEDAKKKADEEIKKILPDGFYTKNHEFYSVDFNNEFAGFAWVEVKSQNNKKVAWGYNIYVEEKFRRQGIAKEIFKILEEKLKNDGVKQINFHVYADNEKAIALYNQFGFETTNIVMRKIID
jgi:ribosomal protein S18 acetylase RimI-like enzyme